MKKPRTPKEPVKASNVFQCLTCEAHPEFDSPAEFKTHLQEVHKLTEFKGKKSMTMDCSDSYHSTYEWEIGGVKAVQATCNPRAKDDLMRFSK